MLSYTTLLCTTTSIPEARNQQEFMDSPKCTRIVDPTPLRHFALSCLLLEHTIITWLSTFAIFYGRTFQLNIVLLTLLLLYRTSNLYLCSVNLWSPLMLKVSLPTYPLRSVLTWRSITFPRAILTLR